MHVVQGSASSVGFCQGGWKGVSRLYMGVGEFIHNDTNTTLHFSHSGNVSKLYLGLQSQYPSLSLIRLFCAG